MKHLIPIYCELLLFSETSESFYKHNYLFINIDKRLIIISTRHKQPFLYGYSINNLILNRCDKVKDLREIFDRKVLFDKQYK